MIFFEHGSENQIYPPSKQLLSEISSIKDKGGLSSHRPQRITHYATEHIEYYLNHRIKSITLQLTQQCNLRCTYCIYSETANQYQRSHTVNRMSFEVAKKALDFFVRCSDDLESVNVGFYGGEPLLEYKLIQKCVQYLQQNYPERKISYSMTSNGTLLNYEIIDFLVNNKFTLMISLDGPQKINDRNRRFKKDGSGTFGAVMENLNIIAKDYPDYLKYVKISVVIDPENDYNEVRDFVDGISKSWGISAHVSMIDDTYSAQKRRTNFDYIDKNKTELARDFLKTIWGSSCAVSQMSQRYLDDVKRVREGVGDIEELPQSLSPSGPCVPGKERLFVNVYGDFYPCERVSEMSSVMKIGTIDKGFDYEKVKTLLNVANITNESCLSCWAMRHCTQCIKYADNGFELNKDKRLNRCSRVIAQVEEKMLDYLMFCEMEYIYGKTIL